MNRTPIIGLEARGLTIRRRSRGAGERCCPVAARATRTRCPLGPPAWSWPRVTLPPRRPYQGRRLLEETSETVESGGIQPPSSQCESDVLALDDDPVTSWTCRLTLPDAILAEDRRSLLHKPELRWGSNPATAASAFVRHRPSARAMVQKTPASSVARAPSPNRGRIAGVAGNAPASGVLEAPLTLRHTPIRYVAPVHGIEPSSLHRQWSCDTSRIYGHCGHASPVVAFARGGSGLVSSPRVGLGPCGVGNRRSHPARRGDGVAYEDRTRRRPGHSGSPSLAGSRHSPGSRTRTCRGSHPKGVPGH